MCHNVGTATHISPDCQSTLSWCYEVESLSCREIGCCKAQQVCGSKAHLAVFLQHQASNIFPFNCSTDAKLAKCLNLFWFWPIHIFYRGKHVLILTISMQTWRFFFWHGFGVYAADAGWAARVHLMRASCSRRP